MPLEIKFTDTGMYEQLMDYIQRVYSHELTPPALKTYMRFELGKLIGKGYDIKKFLEGRE